MSTAHAITKHLCSICTNTAKSSIEFGLPYDHKLPKNCNYCERVKYNKLFIHIHKLDSLRNRIQNRSNKLTYVLKQNKRRRQFYSDWEYDEDGGWYWYDQTGWWYDYDSSQQSSTILYDGYWQEDEFQNQKLKWQKQQQERIDNMKNNPASFVSKSPAEIEKTKLTRELNGSWM